MTGQANRKSSVFILFQQNGQFFISKFDVFDLLRSADLTFDDQFAREIQFIEFRDDPVEIRPAFAKRNFLAQTASVSREHPVLDVEVPHIFPDDFQSVHRIASSIQDQVRRIKIDPEIVQSDVFNGPQQRQRGFLPGFEPESEPEFSAVPGNLADGIHRFRIQRIGGIFRKLAPILEKMLGEADPDYAKKPDIKWNFTKFLVGKDGRIVRRFEPTAPLAEVEEAIRVELAK